MSLILVGTSLRLPITNVRGQPPAAYSKSAVNERACTNGTHKGGATVALDWRLAVAGGLAGGISNLVLYPLDTLKSVQQARGLSLFQALSELRKENLGRLYAGVLPAFVGSMFSSTIYFGSYESCKRFLLSHAVDTGLNRQQIYMIAAFSGNVLSSFIFVPKDVVKQQMQVLRKGSHHAKSKSVQVLQVMSDILKKDGLRGFYPSYRATLLKNIPGAVSRFVVYEELRALAGRVGHNQGISGLNHMKV
jgi:solute carrier family 25 (mitochondrial S-adenosylmethionine transporter), member 26